MCLDVIHRLIEYTAIFSPDMTAEEEELELYDDGLTPAPAAQARLSGSIYLFQCLLSGLHGQDSFNVYSQICMVKIVSVYIVRFAWPRLFQCL